MRETRGWLSMQLTAGVAVMLVAAVSEVTAKPTPGDDTRHITANHVEDQYLDDALVNWLDNFGTYTFMVKQDLDSHAGDPDGGGEEGDEEQEQESGAVEGGEEEEVDALEEWNAPIAVSTGQRSLLNPHHDYLVTVESLVAEEGSIFMTLSKYENETICGVGGLSLEEEVQQVPKSGGGGFVAQEEPGGAGHTTFIAFALQQEENTNATDSGWIAVSEQYWWASGHLTGGNILSITFTPPECGCLALSTYFALPVGNLTLVVGPQAYPDELQTLLCVDPLASVPDHDYEEEGQENGIPEEEEEIDYLQQPSALVALRNPEEEGVEEATQATETPQQQPTVLTQKKKMSKEKKMARKTRRQMKRQRIRQAGRRQARQGQPNNGRKNTRRWNRKKNQRKRARVWKKLNKRGKKGRRGKLGAKHHHQHSHDEEVNGTNPEEMRQYHDHHHHHSAYPTNVSALQHEERLVDILLRDLYAKNSTVEEDGEEDEGDAPMRNEEGEGEGEGEGAQTPRQRRKNRRQRKKMRKQRRKVYGPGVKFCCKQGVKHKKNILEISNTSAIFAECDTSIDVVITFANHQFGIEEDTCTTTYTTCCDNFTEDMWESIKARKAERRTERKQRRKSRRRDRKQRRKQERRLRKGMRRQGNSRHHDPQCTGDACGQAN